MADDAGGPWPRSASRRLRIPELRTERLLLRGLREADFEDWAGIHADLEVVRWIGLDAPLGREDAWRALAYALGHWGLRGFGQWVLEERATGRLLGRAGLSFPDGWPGLEVGWMLGREHWGRGYATEAAHASLDWAFSELDADRVISLIAPDNHRSRRVAERLGATREGRTAIRGHEVEIYGIDRPASAGEDGARFFGPSNGA